jgi:hypothetical protein
LKPNNETLALNLNKASQMSEKFKTFRNFRYPARQPINYIDNFIEEVKSSRIKTYQAHLRIKEKDETKLIKSQQTDIKNQIESLFYLEKRIP